LAAIKAGKKLEWDPEKERDTNDESAMQYVTGAYRDPWKLEKFVSCKYHHPYMNTLRR